VPSGTAARLPAQPAAPASDMGVQSGDDSRIERLMNQMLDHQDAHGRFASFGRARSFRSRTGAVSGPSVERVPVDHLAVSHPVSRVTHYAVRTHFYRLPNEAAVDRVVPSEGDHRTKAGREG
jgi:hypothetical protein